MRAAAALMLVLLAAQLSAQSPCAGPGPVPFQDHEHWGYLSGDGVVIAPRFDVAGPFGRDGAIACVANQCGVIDRTGAFVSPTWDRYTRPFPEQYAEGLAAANKNGDWGYIDAARRVVIPFQYSYAGQFEQGIARVKKGQKFFFIDKLGNRITPEFDGAFDFHEGLAAVEVNKAVGYIRRDGSFALSPSYRSASGIDFSEGLAAVRVNGKVGFMDKNGNVVIEPRFDDVYPFSDGLAPVRVGDDWGYVDRNGNLAIPLKFHIGHMFSEGLASVNMNDKWGYIDRSGRFVVPPIFDSAMPFCGGVAAVETFQIIGTETRGCRSSLYRGKRGFIDHAGDYIWRDAEEKTWPSPFCF